MIDKHQCLSLMIGTLGLYLFACGQSFLQEIMLVRSYHNTTSQQYDSPIHCPQGMILMPKLTTWAFTSIYNKLTIAHRANIPSKNSFLCALTMIVSNFTVIYAIIYTSYPIVMVFKSCNLLVVIMFAYFFTRVKDVTLLIGKQKFITAFSITIGVLIYNIFDPQSQKRNTTTEIGGILLLIISLLFDGIAPDLQAQIKYKFQPQATQMMQQINKYFALLALFISIIKFTLFTYLQYILEHPLYAFHLMIYSALGLCIQMFKYRMIKQFKQHIVPFVMASRKIINILLSVFIIGHDYAAIQFVGVFIIFASIMYEFWMEISITKTKKKQKQPETKYLIKKNGIK